MMISKINLYVPFGVFTPRDHKRQMVLFPMTVHQEALVQVVAR